MIGTLLDALLPIAMLIGLGTAIGRSGFLQDAFWPSAERLCYFVLLPALFFHGMATADLLGVPKLALAVVLVGTISAVSLVLLVLRGRVPITDAGFTSFFQGAIRFNNYAALTAAIGLFGISITAIAALATATIVTCVNILCAAVFARYGTSRAGVTGLVRNVLTNPLVLACLLGGLFQLTDLPLPAAIDATLKAAGQAALPLGLICVGASLRLRPLGDSPGPVLAASAVKLLVMPALTLLACMWIGLDTQSALIAVLFQAMPTASSSYVMARQLGGDAPLMAGIIAFQTLAAVVTVPVFVVAAELLR